MALDAIKNFAKVEVSTGYDDSATSIELSSGEGSKLPDPSVDGEFNLVWWNSTDYSDPSGDPNVEIVRCTARSTDTLTVTRAQESTAASTKNTADKTYKMLLGVTAKMITDIESAFVPYTGADSNVDLGSNDLTTTGDITAGNLNVSNWDTAYGWGDHSVEGYLTDITGESIGDLSDVNDDTPSDKDVFIYDGVTDNRYENRALVEADISDLSHYTDSDVDDYLSGGTGIGYSTGTISLSHLGLESLTDPNADRIAFWDDGEGAFKWLTPNTLISISGTDLNVDNDLSNYDNTTSGFLTGITGESIDDLSDVDDTNKGDGRILKYNSTSGNLEYDDESGDGGNLVDDTSPQLGGNLDTNGYSLESELPSTRMDDWDSTDLVNYLKNIHHKNQNIEFKAGTYAHGTTAVNNAYQGGVYSPTQNRIYFVPYGQADEINWHYIDCSDGSIIIYAHGATAVDGAYIGGVYSPTQNRIYFVPRGQADETNWHYIDCSDGSVNAYAHGVTAVDLAYHGGVYSPTQNRIYLVPFGQADETNWHYIDCSDGSVNAYAHGATVGDGAYHGGVYSPTQNRIYFVPCFQADETNWHYIDCSDGSVNAYAHGVTAVNEAYRGGVYSPTQNRIYFVPYGQADETNWHYIDCSDGSVNAYAHGVTAVNAAYYSGVYSPAQNRIYFVPSGQADETNWHYIDCSDGSVNAYAHGTTAVNNAYYSGVYSPTQNRIYLVPFGQTGETNWHYIQEFSTPEISPSIAANTLFNKL